jgi:beta-glucanase (GH16 family)
MGPRKPRVLRLPSSKRFGKVREGLDWAYRRVFLPLLIARHGLILHMKYLRYLCLSFILYSCSKGGSSNKNNANLPSAVAQNTSQERADTNSHVRFFVSLNVPASSPITLNFATQDGTALANKDYVPKSGTLTIPSGQLQGYADIEVIGDSLRQAPQVFYVGLSNPVNCTIATARGTATIQNDGTYLPTDTSGYSTPSAYPGFTLVWSDEFSGDTVSTNNWNFETGNNNGWGNNELENYTGRVQNVFQSLGNLVIEARSENYNGSSYTSARMTTQGKQQFQFGRIDIRAKLPVSSGMWPALWMLGANFPQVGWPTCGETDIMELVGLNPAQVVGSVHWSQQGGTEGTTNNSYNLPSGDFSQKFHVFSVIWKQDSIQMLVDDQVYMSANSQNLPGGGAWPFNSPSFFIFNVAVGGAWPGPPNATTVFPQHMFVDYVRVFQ